MTLTNHIRRIQELGSEVIKQVDRHNYPAAHSALDDIEARCQAAHVHVDNLQHHFTHCPVAEDGDVE